MSNLFEEFSESEPEFIDLSGIETDAQLRLRERFDSLAVRNTLEVALFDPTIPEAYRQMHCSMTSFEKHFEEAEPEVTKLLRQKMLRSSGLMPPDDDTDARSILDRQYKNGIRVAMFSITGDDESMVPVYFQTDKDGVPDLITLMSYAKTEETVLHYRDLDEYRTKLQLKLNVGGRAVSNYSVEDLKWFDATFDTIQKL